MQRVSHERTGTGEQNLIRYGTREIDFTRYVGIGDYTIRSMANPHDGTLYWVRWGRKGGVVSRVPATREGWSGADSEDVFDLGMRSFWAPTYHPPSKSFYFVSDENNEETFNVYRLPESMDGLERVTDVGYTMGYTFSPRADRLVFLGRPEKLGKTTCLFELPLDRSADPTPLFTDDDRMQIYPYMDPVIDDDDQWIAFVVKRNQSRSRKQLAIYSRATGKTEVVTEMAIGRNFLLPLGWHAHRLLLISDEGTQRQSVYEFDADTRQVTLVEENPYLAADGIYVPRTRRVVVEFRDGRHGQLVLIDAPTGKVVTRQDSPEFDFWWCMCHPLGDGTYSVSSKLRKGREVLVCRLDVSAEHGGHLLTVGYEPDLNQHQADPCEMRDITYPTFDLYQGKGARQIESVLFMPRELASDPARRAAIVWAHGGPNGRTTKSWHANIQLLVAMGYIVLGPNPRGSSGQGKEFEDLNNHDWGGGDYLDYEYGLRYLMNRFQIPLGRIGMAGFSFGGYMTNWAVTRPNGLFAFGISLAGVSDLARSVAESVVATSTISEMGDYDENAAPYHERSPIAWAEYMDVPLLLIHGERDYRTSTNQSRFFYQKLKSLQKDVDLLEIPGEGHGFRALDSQQLSFQRQAEFLHRVAPLD